jgi:murein DD-endopeptidase MepM/ murein hydrolase activator NlpD
MENLTPVRPASIIGNSRLREIKTIKGIAQDLVKQKKQNFELEKKFFKIQKDTIDRNKLRDKERLQEAKKPKRKAGFVREELKDKSIKLFDLFKFFVGYKVLQWMSRKENIESIGEIAKAMKNIFKIIDHLAGIGVEGVLGGLHSVLFGSNFLERFFGIFKLIGGFFIIRRLLFPGKILKDITWILKNRKSIGKVFQALGSGKLKEALGRLFKLLTPNLYVVYTRGLTAGVKRVILKVFGKNTLKLLTKVASKIGFRSAKEFVKNTAKNIAKPLTRIPFIGPILGFGLNLIFGDPLDKAAVKAIGAGIGAWLGGIVMGALGSIVPVAGTAAGAGLGAFVGGFIGDWVGDKLYGFFKGFTAPKEPALAVGGIVTKPTRALIGEAGPEAVIPLPKIYDGTILNAPMGIVASSMIGGIDAVISSLGPVGLTIRPYASSLLAPYRREFGSTNYVFTSNIGGKTTPLTTKLPEQNDNEEVAKILGLNKTINLIKKKETAEEAKKARYNSGNSVREILGDILNNIINLDFTKKSKKKTRPGDTTRNGDIGEVGGEVDLSDADDRTLLKQLALAEAAGEGVVGMALVVNSVLNRKRILDGGASPGLFHATDKTIRGIIYAKDSVQYTPVQSGTINKQWGEGSLNLAEKALQMGMDKSKLRQALEAEGVSENSIKFLINSTGFRNYDAGASNDRSQKVNETVYKRHTFNTAGVPKMQQGGLVSRGDITSKFGNKESFRKNSHEGIDIAFPSGTPLSFTLGGKFLKVARSSSKEREANGGYGQYMDLKLSDGKIARLAHLSSIPNWVKQGGDFTPNAIVALSGGAPGAPGSGRSGGPHLHLEQHTTQKDLAETLNGKVDPLSQGLFGLLRKGGAPGSATSGPAQPSQSPAASPNTVKESEESQQESQPPPINYDDIAKNLGELFQMLTGTPKTNGAQLQKNSMDYVQAFKDFKPNPDTYIMMGGTNIISSTTLLTPIEQLDYSSGSFSSIDSATAFKLNTRL